VIIVKKRLAEGPSSSVKAGLEELRTFIRSAGEINITVRSKLFSGDISGVRGGVVLSNSGVFFENSSGHFSFDPSNIVSIVKGANKWNVPIVDITLKDRTVIRVELA
jgi:hypothetical protein